MTGIMGTFLTRSNTTMTRQLPRDKYEQRMAGIRMGRIGRPEEVAQVIALYA
jgi:NAD(P)-dependent dehydrogenase (short-subunit alcohol dehydrogenase family)